MNSSFYNGISGIKSHQFGIDVQANNIANISTIGFKNSAPEFSTQFSTVLSDSYFDSTSNNVGYGSRASTTVTDMSQGIFQPTDSVFDLSIGGEGWFGVQSMNGENLYTRAGSFSVDAQGNMVDANGNYLLGTSANNLTQTALRNDILEAYGNYYNKDTIELGEGYSVSSVDNITLTSTNTQSLINLPKILYLPPVATTYVNYKANLDPEILIESTNVDIDSTDVNDDITSGILNITGTVSNTTNILNPKKDDTVIVTTTDIDGKELTFKTTLDENLNWTIQNEDINGLNLSDTVIVNAKLQTVQEIPNTEHFSTEVISADGKKQIIDLEFTKRVPQNALSTTWDSTVKLLEFFEDYEVINYDPDTVYDETIYQVNHELFQVSKIYDPALYHVDTTTKKVYQIIDQQTGTATFGGAGNLMSEDIPSLSSNGAEIDINIGTPYEQTDIPIGAVTYQDGNVTISGSAPNLSEGESITVTFTDIDSNTITTSAKIQADGTWSSTEKYIPSDPSAAFTSISAFNIINNGFDGMISHVDLAKLRVADKDGYYEGVLNNYGMDGEGNVVAEFSNGRSAAISKVAIYHFQNDQGLDKVSSTLFSASANSGDAIFYTDSNGNYIQGSSIYSNKLESSNVNFATALTELIVMQKAFDASSKSITTSDQMIQNAINMKR